MYLHHFTLMSATMFGYHCCIGWSKFSPLWHNLTKKSCLCKTKVDADVILLQPLLLRLRWLSVFVCRWSYWTCTSSAPKPPTAIAAVPRTSPLTVNGGRFHLEGMWGETPFKDFQDSQKQSHASFRLLLLWSSLPHQNYAVLFSSVFFFLGGGSSRPLHPTTFALETFECNCCIGFRMVGSYSTHFELFFSLLHIGNGSFSSSRFPPPFINSGLFQMY